MGRDVLILAGHADIHALFLRESIERAGGRCTIWNLSDFPRSTSVSIRLDTAEASDRTEVWTGGEPFSDREFDVIWNRRFFSGQLYDKRLHPGDLSFVKEETSLFLRSLLYTFAPRALWVNKPVAKHSADAKMFQLYHARAAGLHVPRTLATNCPDDLKAFYAQCGKPLLIKSFHGHAWNGADESAPERVSWSVNFAARVTPDELSDAGIRSCPAIYQEYTEKLFELRILLCGKTLYAVKVDSQSTAATSTDFRPGQQSLPLSEYELPEPVSSRILDFADRAGIVFGSFDFIVTPSMEYVFLEVNEQGQFLWMEENNPDLPILQLTTDFFNSGDPLFSWQRPRNCVRMSDIETPSFKEAYKQALRVPDYLELNTKNGWDQMNPSDRKALQG